MSTLQLQGKVAIVTGSSRSIGAAIANRLAVDGAYVVVNYVRDANSAANVVQQINNATRGRAIAVQADVGSPEGRRSLVESAVKEWGKIHILINTAGYSKPEPIDKVTEKDFDDHIDVNVKGPLFLTQAVLPHMSAGSRIIFFSSSLCRTTENFVLSSPLNYVAAKGAVEQITRVLAKDLAKRQITVNTISPGPIDTPLFRAGKTEEAIQRVQSFIPHGRLGTTDDVKGVAAFLAGPESGWITGQVIRVDGGFTV